MRRASTKQRPDSGRDKPHKPHKPQENPAATARQALEAQTI
ncbi:hypothetical protein BLL52_1207 [Rhodoferax antarcticus ANT.BR]|uniref:Single-minded C-terminal domain-containing protein n=1 Tax=Rhodoferax antarcticus ANT.BR TaxID=1111071 RepID=A0A1Q8YHE1_9BURK|nr:hypothetical protein BLL52_1207 [Rhodoferax antarcticus ANT.BR]